MRRQKKIVVFDFDGVVCESTDECMVSSWNAWENWQSRDGFRMDLSEFSDADQEAFRKVRPRVRGAGEYYILRRAFEEGIAIDSQDDYNELEQCWRNYLDDFKSVFFEMRNQLRNENLDHWIDLHPVFNHVIDVMKKLNEQDRLYMATLKDAESVRLILGKQGIIIPPERLLDQSQIKSKLQALDIFRDHVKCQKNEMVFVDDNVMHLLEPHAAYYPVYLTTWGSVMDEYLEIARENGIPRLKDPRILLNDF